MVVLTNSMEHSPSWEYDDQSRGQNIRIRSIRNYKNINWIISDYTDICNGHTDITHVK
jgi:hypothetical protein